MWIGLNDLDNRDGVWMYVKQSLSNNISFIKLLTSWLGKQSNFSNIHRWSDASLFGYNQWDTSQRYPDSSNLGWYCVYQRTKDNNGITFSFNTNQLRHFLVLIIIRKILNMHVLRFFNHFKVYGETTTVTTSKPLFASDYLLILLPKQMLPPRLWEATVQRDTCPFVSFNTYFRKLVKKVCFSNKNAYQHCVARYLKLGRWLWMLVWFEWGEGYDFGCIIMKMFGPN